MQILVQKFGGTSVQSNQSRKHVLRHIENALNNDFKLVVVVSALGRSPDPYATDSLLELVDYPEHSITNRELDMLMVCGEIIASVVLSNELRKSGISSIALTGAQAGIKTNADFNQAKIKEVEPSRILTELKKHDVVVVAGFQGKNLQGELTTLGRGGSDTTAAALGAALAAKSIEIFTDVNGIMTADPRVVKNARALDIVSYREICNLAYQGAKVIHPRAVEIAMHAKVPIRVRSTYEENGGTLVTNTRNGKVGVDISDRVVTGIAHLANITQIKVQTKEKEAYRLQSEVFKAMADAGISIDFINISPTGVIYTVPNQQAKRAITILKSKGFNPSILDDCTKVSVVGAGMTGVPGVASRIVHALTSKGVQILQSADSHTTIWVLIPSKDLFTAVNALHEEFDLSNQSTILHDFLTER
ncbi:aspartate kinase [Ornithinibacillus bavariensis]|uniref:Aspartokinase n=1 Tax=Ornithinibacillus bavariensis TaxID=545502 RepID=A0A919X624_9BACI|nr:aspartate kinase [Ornithinibacillus bavariensis]GIO26206.1 aspartokinase [Ornithinibacillus bavariensis]HAM79446.1 aspartate kinase [Ornithinibacillus sp.]